MGYACIGLVTAVDKYDPDTSGAFASYASLWIIQNISRVQCTQRPLVYYPVHQKEGYFTMYINVPSGKMDLAVTLTRNDEEHFMKIDSILSVELDPYINATPQSIESMAAVRLAKSLVPLAAKTDVVAEAFSWARFINQTGISRTLLNHPLTKLGEKLCSEHRALDFHQAVFDSTYRDKLLAQI